MTSYLFDTNVVSEMRKKKPHGGVVSWIAHLRPEQIFLSAVTIGELQKGVELTREQDPFTVATCNQRDFAHFPVRSTTPSNSGPGKCHAFARLERREAG
jgi:hypothetical protein